MPIELIVALVLVAAMLCQWLAWRVKLPAILFLLIVGLLAGPVAGWLNPDAIFGDLLMPMVSLSVAVILFEGSLTLNLREIKGVSKVVQRMVTVGALVTWVIVAVATHYIFQFSWQVCALFGAVVIVTGPTVIVPMLRSVRPARKLANILRWEGIIIDPIGALMAVLTYEFILSSTDNPAIEHILLLFLYTTIVGIATGVLAGIILGRLLAHNLIPEYLQNLTALSLVLVAFTVSNAIEHESGLIAVTVMGMWLANKADIDIHPILNFKEHLSLLLISILFIFLAARIDLTQLLHVFWQALVLLVIVQFIARPAKILVSTLGADISWQERGLLAWIAPRGIVAAAISAIFADRLVSAGYQDAALLVPLTFFIIIGTVILQSSTARLVAKGLGVAEPSPKGFLMIGANVFSRAVAKELTKHGFRCVLADSNRENIRLARMAGLETFYGSAVSDYADSHLDLSGIGALLAMSRQRYVNIVAAVHFRADFGGERIFSLATADEKNIADKHKVADSYQGNQLFADDITYSELVQRMNRGCEVKSTTLSEEFDWNTYKTQYETTRLPLFEIDNKGHVKPFTVANDLCPSIGSVVVALETPRPETDSQ